MARKAAKVVTGNPLPTAAGGAITKETAPEVFSAYEIPYSLTDEGKGSVQVPKGYGKGRRKGQAIEWHW